MLTVGVVGAYRAPVNGARKDLRIFIIFQVCCVCIGKVCITDNEVEYPHSCEHGYHEQFCGELAG